MMSLHEAQEVDKGEASISGADDPIARLDNTALVIGPISCNGPTGHDGVNFGVDWKWRKNRGRKDRLPF